MPTKKQVDNNRATANFNPVLGGYYNYGTLYGEATHGSWWGSEAHNNGALRYSLGYNGSSLYAGGNGRRTGFYIRCVSEEKTVLDLTYMQDMALGIMWSTIR